MKKSSSVCVRVYADQEAIEQGKSLLKAKNRELDHLAKGLGLAGNKVRLSILFLLHRNGKLCVCDLSDVLGMTMAAVSQHLRKLKDGGFVKPERVGQTIFYQIQEKQIVFLDTLLSFLEISESEFFELKANK
ncbi:MAG: metalloregulator ArsR/SmtB family transcription factor [Bacteroidia bacterium]|nr:metalloregulator ArsR/SmtB family transcription factor [Bacteroidia bacterium]